VFAVRPIGAGETFTADSVRVLRNGANAPGLPPRAYARVLGRRATRAIVADAPITATMVQDGAELA
jgi:sialic acid synthase SpsE